MIAQLLVGRVSDWYDRKIGKPTHICIAQYLVTDHVLVAHTSLCGSLVDAGRFSRSSMCKTAFYACVLLLALIGEQLSPYTFDEDCS